MIQSIRGECPEYETCLRGNSKYKQEILQALPERIISNGNNFHTQSTKIIFKSQFYLQNYHLV